ncbi:MAG: 2-hydroxyacyl-CoA dehydratase family protein [Desulfobacca sp.]|uniref:2-hydroxyacyl-CoA dehydratase family protein n=1 Tax=Desulfobacca sp. TaxID=2067990 RepID=UPI004049CA39
MIPRPGTRVGFTTTIPVEVLLAAGLRPVDLNNIFITAADAYDRVSGAEEEGWPRTVCAWIKGIYTTLQRQPDISTVIVVTQGDCSNTHALMELLQAEGRTLIPFQFPYPRRRGQLQAQIEALTAACGTHSAAVHEVWRGLQPLRAQLVELDRLTWETGQVSCRENFRFLIASSDFNGDPVAFGEELQDFLATARSRPSRHREVRLGLVGIPPIFTNLFDYLEELPVQVVFQEIPRQFSMPYRCPDLTAQYLRYTYPYDIFARLADIRAAVNQRRLTGLIHYTQSFCFRQIQDRLLRQQLHLPILTIEGDRPTPLDHRTRLRLEAFVDVLRR